MVLSDLQKLIINAFIRGNYIIIEDFIRDISKLKEDKSPHNIVIGEHGGSINIGMPIFIPHDRVLLLEKLNVYFMLCAKLEQLGYIHISTTTTRKPLPIFKEDTTLRPDKDLNYMIIPYLSKEVTPLPSLKEFVDNKFMTPEEHLLYSERRDRKTAQILTVIIAFLSILVSIFSIWFNYKTYRTERVVTIRNQNAFPETTKVIILKPEQETPNKIKH